MCVFLGICLGLQCEFQLMNEVMGLPREAHDYYGQHKGGCMGV